MFIHLSDTHLGYSDFNKIDFETGLNQREVDVHNAFKWVVDYILKTKPRFVIHAGDLFDTPRPPNRTISFTLLQLEKLSRAKIPTVLISGNHSTPRMSISGSIFESFKVLPNIYPVCRGKYEQIKIDDFIIHCVPHCSTEEIMQKNLENIAVDKSFKNILAVHAGLTGKKSYQTGEFNEQKVPLKLFTKHPFDYVALGHYHHYKKVSSNAYYSGATERFGFNFAGTETGFLHVNTPGFKVKFVKIPSRPMRNFRLDATNLSVNQLQTKLKKLSKEAPKDSVILVNLEGVKREIWLALDKKKIEQNFKQVLNWELRPSFYQKRGDWAGKTHIDDLPIEFNHFVDSLKKSEKERNLIKKLGLDYLQKAQVENL